MRVRQINLRKLWLSLLLLVGATAIAVPGIQEIAEGDVAEINGTGYAKLQDAFDAATDGQTITLLGDITQDDGFKFDRSNVSAKLNLNNHTLTVNKGVNVNNRAIRIDNGTLEVYGGSIVAVGSGTTSSNGTGCYGAFRVEANGKLIAHDLTLSNARPFGLNVKVLGGEAELTNVTINSSFGGGIEVTEADLGTHSKTGKATLTDCNFTQENYFDHCSTAISVSGGSEVVVNSGSYIGEQALYVFSSGGVITINGGTFEGRGNNNRAAFISAIDTNTYPEYTGGMQLNDGTFKGNFSIKTPSYAVVKGGTYTTDPTPYLEEGLKAVQNNGTWTVQEKTYVAQIGEGENAVKYESLEEALAAISTVTTAKHPKSGLTINQYKANGTVSLLADCEGNGIVVDSGSELTIDFAGHTYSVTGDLVGSDQTEYNGFQLLQNSNVTFKSTAEEPGVINSAKAIFLVQNYSNLTLENMTLDGSNLSGSGAYTLSNNCGNVVIENSTITAKEGAGNFAFDVCRYKNYPSVNVTVKGESVINGDIEVSASGSDAKDGFGLTLNGGEINGSMVLDATAAAAMDATPAKAVIQKADAVELAAPEGYKWNESGILVKAHYVAQAGGVKYESLVRSNC